MAYNDSNFNTRVTRSVVGTPQAGVAFGTFTSGAGTNTITDQVPVLPTFYRATKVTAINVYPVVAANNKSDFTMIFLNGTNTMATLAITSATPGAGTWARATMSTASHTNTEATLVSPSNPSGLFVQGNVVMTASTLPTIKILGTATASADVIGTYYVEFEVQEVFYNNPSN